MLSSPNTFPEDALIDLTLLALVIAHGADADLDPREVDTLSDRLHGLAPHLSGDEVIRIVKEGAKVYLDTRVEGAETVVHRLAGALSPEDRARAYETLRAVAEADHTVHPMESTLLRHVAAAWRLNRD
ncbi:MAG: TerB family tellurite resistance protein [Rhodothermales bacterium]